MNNVTIENIGWMLIDPILGELYQIYHQRKGPITFALDDPLDY